MADYPITAVDRRTVLSGSAGTGPYAFSFPVLTQTDLDVYKDTTKLTLTTDYTVSIGAAGTGTVTLGVAASGSNTITIVGARAIQRTTDFVTAGDLLASSLNTELDSQTIFAQQVSEDAARAIKAPVTDPTSIDMTLPAKASRLGKILAFDATTGNPTIGDDVGNYRGNWAASTVYTERDLVKDTSTNNIFRANTAHTSSGSQPLTSNTDSAKWDLLVDAATASASATAAAASATAAATSATASATSATASATSATASASSATSSAASAVTSTAEASAANPKYTFSTSTSMADPGAGTLRYNHGTVASVSAIALDDTTADTGNPDIEAWLKPWDDSTSTIKGWLRLVEPGTPANYAVFHITGLTDSSGFIQLAVTHVDSNGTFGNGDSIRVMFSRTGDKGDTGSQGPAGAGVDTLTTRGDLLAQGASAAGRLAIGSANTVLTTDGTDPAWSTVTNAMLAGSIDLTSKVTGTLPLGNGGIGATSLASANIVATNAQNTFTKAQLPSTYTAALSATSGVLDYDTYTNFIITLASGSNTLAAATTEASQVGQCGVIIFIQPSSSSAGTLSLHADYETAAAGGITLSSANNDYDVVPYMIKADNSILLGAAQRNFG